MLKVNNNNGERRMDFVCEDEENEGGRRERGSGYLSYYILSDVFIIVERRGPLCAPHTLL